VTLKFEPDPDTGFVIDLKKLSLLIREHVIETVDHKNLNLDVPYLEGVLPSCENIISAFWDILFPKISALAPNAQLYQLRLFETPRNYVDYYG